jgi:hypothetical protein
MITDSLLHELGFPWQRVTGNFDSGLGFKGGSFVLGVKFSATLRSPSTVIDSGLSSS